MNRTFPEVLIRVPAGTRVRICLRLLLSFLATPRQCSSKEVVQFATSDWGVTTPRIHHVNYTWLINDWLPTAHRLPADRELESPRFSPTTGPDFVFYLQMFPRGNRSDRVSVRLHYQDGPTRDVQYDLVLALMDKRGRARNESRSSNAMVSRGGRNEYDLVERRYIEEHAEEVLTGSGQLRVLVDLTVYHSYTSYGGQCGRLDRSTDRGCDMDRFLMNATYTDGVVVTKGGHRLPVHKVVLATRSRVLDEAFQEVGEEVQVDEVELETMREVLRYAYTSRVQNLDKMAAKLMMAAHVLEMEGLRAMCEAELCGHINAKNAYEIYAVASRYKAEALRRKVAEFIGANKAEVAKSESFRRLGEQHPVCIADLMGVM